MCSFSFSAKIAFLEVQHMLLQWAMFEKLNAKQKSLLLKCHSQDTMIQMWVMLNERELAP